VIQEHHATALHWDFRLERDGVGVSWAVPKGLPLDPGRNNLAVQTEDHPLEYFSFEGEIPAGEYGGGRVIIWDAGTYDTDEWEPDKVKVVLRGERVQGRYVLFRTDGKHWMVHRMDPPPAGWTPPPAQLRPMLAVPADSPPTGDGWAHEFKWDGVRAIVTVDGGRPRVTSRNDRDVTTAYPETRALAEAMGSTQAVLDGELVALDDAGRPSFERLQRRMHLTNAAQVRRLQTEVPVTFLVFDLLHLDGRSLLDEPYDERRRLLESLELSGPHWATSPSFDGDGATILSASTAQGLEGIVSKRRDSRYFAGKRSDCWLKVKPVATREAVIGGWEPGKGNRQGQIGALHLGVTTDEGLAYVGQVGSGFSEATLRDLAARLAPLHRPDPPFVTPVPRDQARGAHWVEPVLVAEVAYSSWTKDGKLRHPTYRGLRPDKDPSEVVREP
jgi:bifunctional non-homologous end joining protein LigD